MTTRLLPFKRSSLSGLGGILLTTLGGAVGCSFDSDSISFVPDDQLGSGNAAGTAGATGATAGTGGSATAGSSGSSGSSAGGSGGTAGSTGGTGGNMGGSAGTAGSGGTAGSSGTGATAGSGGSAGTAGSGGSAGPSITFTINETTGSISFGRPEAASFHVEVSDFPGLKQIEIRRSDQPTNSPPIFSNMSGNVLDGQGLITSSEAGTYVATATDMSGGSISEQCSIVVAWQGGDNSWSLPVSFDFERGVGDMGVGYDKAQAISVSNDGGVYVGGYSYRGTTPGEYGLEKRMAFLRLNKDGVVEGSFILAGVTEQELRGLAIQSNTLVSFTGMAQASAGTQGNNVYAGAIKLDATSMPAQAPTITPQWSDSFDGGGGSEDLGLAVASSFGNTVVSGYVNTGDMNLMEVGFLKAYSPNGSPVWTMPFGSDSGSGFKDMLTGVTIDPGSNQIWYVGETYQNGIVGLVGRIDPDLSNPESTRLVQPGADVHLTGIAMHPTGDAIVCGYTQPLNNSAPALFAARVHSFSDGALWLKQFPSPKRAQGVGCSVDKWGNIVLLASQSPDALEARVVRIREDGNVVWDRSFGNGIEPTAIAVDHEGFFYLVGVDHLNDTLGAANFYVNKLFL